MARRSTFTRRHRFQGKRELAAALSGTEPAAASRRRGTRTALRAGASAIALTLALGLPTQALAKLNIGARVTAATTMDTATSAAVSAQVTRSVNLLASQRARMAASAAAAAANAISAFNGTQSGALVADNLSSWQNADLTKKADTADADGGYRVEVTQSAPTATAYWETFNIGSKTTLDVIQKLNGVDQSGWVLVNKISNQVSPSQIYGAINAPGQIYILNSNGTVFYNGARINTNLYVVSPQNEGINATGLSVAGGMTFDLSVQGWKGASWDGASLTGVKRVDEDGTVQNNNDACNTATCSYLLPVTSDGRYRIDVTETTDKAKAYWDKFNVGTRTTLNIVQKDANNNDQSEWILLNDVVGSSAPAIIAGTIAAPGETYIIDTAGVTFSSTAAVRVHTLLASALDFNQNMVSKDGDAMDVFDSGITNENYAVESGSSQLLLPQFLDPSKSSTARVSVESGAVIETVAGDSIGTVMLFGPTVSNAGTIMTPDGQTILAAGRAVFLGYMTDTGYMTIGGSDQYLIGLSTRTGGGDFSDTNDIGRVINNGSVLAERGDIVLTGSKIDQTGSLIATTSVTTPGVICLLAFGLSDSGDPLEPYQNTNTSHGVSTGKVTLGAGSVTDVLPDDESALSYDSALGTSSKIDIVGSKIILEGANSTGGVATEGALVYAPSGDVSILSAPYVRLDNYINTNDIVYNGEYQRVYIGDGARIDVSGLWLERPISDVVLKVQVQGTQLKDSPTQTQDGEPFYYGDYMYVDLRNTGTRSDGSSWIGTPLFHVEGYLASRGQTAEQLSTTGGNVTIVSSGDIVMASGANVSVSGGGISYAAGTVTTTTLVSSGRTYDISKASPDLIYSGYGAMNSLDSPGYAQGSSAGTMTLTSSSMVIDKGVSLTGAVTVGPYQRQLHAAWTALNTPTGGSLIIGNGYQGAPPTIVLADPSKTLAQEEYAISALADPMNDPLPADRKTAVYLPVAIFNDGGFGSISIISSGRIIVPASTSISADGANISLKANAIDIEGDISAAGGSISAVTSLVLTAPGGTGDGQPVFNVALSGQSVTTVTVANSYDSYAFESPPNVIFVTAAGDTGSGAVGSAILDSDGHVIGINVTSGGSGYQSAPYVILQGLVKSFTGTLPYLASDQYEHSLKGHSVIVGASAVLSTRGRWINDMVSRNNYDAAILINGGMTVQTATANDNDSTIMTESAQTVTGGVTISAGRDVTIAETSVIDVSAGAWLKSDGTLVAGSGGKISITGGGGYFSSLDTTFFTPGTVSLGSDSVFRGYGVTSGSVVGKGGSLTINAPAVQIGGSSVDSDFQNYVQTQLGVSVNLLSPDLFQSGGFSSYAVDAPLGLLVTSSIDLTQTKTYFFDYVAAQKVANSSGVLAFSTLKRLDDAWRVASSLTLSSNKIDGGAEIQIPGSSTEPTIPYGAYYDTGTGRIVQDVDLSALGLNGLSAGTVAIAKDVEIEGDIGASVTIKAAYLTDIAGTIDVPAGTISASGTYTVLEKTGRLYARGAFKPAIPASGFTTKADGTVMAGGSVTLSGAVDTLSGSEIDVSGTSHSVVLQKIATGITRQTISSEGGAIVVKDAPAFTLAGLMKASGGNGAEGGSLSLSLVGFIVSGRTIITNLEVMADAPAASDLVPVGTVFQNAISVSGKVSEDALADGGFDSVYMLSRHSILLDDGVTVRGMRSLVLDAPAIRATTAGATVNIGDTDVDYVALTNSSFLYYDPNSVATAALTPDSTLTVTAGLIDVYGNVAFNGVKTATLNSASDIRLEGRDLSVVDEDGATYTLLMGMLYAPYDLILKARQVYPTTASEFLVSAAHNLTVTQRGTPGAVPLSAGGNLTLQAPTIEQNGTVRAPLGSITIAGGTLSDGTATADGSDDYVADGTDRFTADGSSDYIDQTTGSAMIGGTTLPKGTILKAGTVLPVGYLADKTGTVSFGKSSLTSVSSGNQIIPYGQTSNGYSWSYDIDGGNEYFGVNGTPDKVIIVAASSGSVEAGAQIDVSGGSGDVYAWEFTSGRSGTNDVLDDSNQNVFAILPQYTAGTVAPYDPSYYQNYRATGGVSTDSTVSTWKVGQIIHIDNNPLVPDGDYLLLPAHYALLPGGIKVTVKGTSGMYYADDTVIKETSGSVLVSGKLTVSGANSSAKTNSLFELTSGTTVRKQGQYSDTYGDTFFPSFQSSNSLATTRTAQDAGQVIFRVTNALDLSGVKFLMAPGATNSSNVASDALGGMLDIDATNIAVLGSSQLDSSGQLYRDNGFVVLSSDDLTASGAQSLLLGGYRSQESDGVHVTVDAKQIVVDNGGNRDSSGALKTLALPELILVATGVADTSSPDTAPTEEDPTKTGAVAGNFYYDTGIFANAITVASNSVIVGGGTYYGTAPSLIFNPIQANTVSNSGVVTAEGWDYGAVLRVSTGGDITIARQVPVDAYVGTLLINTGVRVGTAEGNDALPATVYLEGSSVLDFSSGALAVAENMTISSSRISFGDVPDSVDTQHGVVISGLSLFSNAAGLRFHSYTSIDIYGNVVLGSSALKRLELDAAGIAAYDVTVDGETQSSNLTATAQTLILSSSSGTFSAATGQTLSTDGAFVLNGTVVSGASDSGTVTLGAGDKSTHGFKTVTLNGQQRITLTGKGALDIADGATVLFQTPGIVGGASGNQSVTTSGRAVIDGVSSGNELPSSQVGAVFALTAEMIDVKQGGAISLPSGSVTLTATGADADGVGVLVESGARIFAIGSRSTYYDVTTYGDGGSVTINATTGKVRLLSGSTVDVSASGGNGGSLTVDAAQGLDLGDEATLNGAGAGEGGSFTAIFQSLGSDAFSALIGHLSAFNGGLDIRVKNGDIVVSANSTISAHKVVLSADQGKIDIFGTIIASGRSGASKETLLDGGTITLSAGNYLYDWTNTGTSSASLSVPSGHDVILEAGGKLIAQGATGVLSDSSTYYGAGGTASLSSESGVVETKAGSLIDVSGAKDSSGVVRGDSGKILFRLPAANVATRAALDALLLGARDGATAAHSVQVELFKVYDVTDSGGNIDDVVGVLGDATTSGTIIDDANNFYLSGMGNQYGEDNAANYDDSRADYTSPTLWVMPGAEVVNTTGDLTLTNKIDFYSLMGYSGPSYDSSQSSSLQGAQAVIEHTPGVLTLRAAGNLWIGADITDGFATAQATVGASSGNTVASPSGYNALQQTEDENPQRSWSVNDSVLMAGYSWAYNLISGADLSAANIETVGHSGNTYIGGVRSQYLYDATGTITARLMALTLTGITVNGGTSVNTYTITPTGVVDADNNVVSWFDIYNNQNITIKLTGSFLNPTITVGTGTNNYNSIIYDGNNQKILDNIGYLIGLLSNPQYYTMSGGIAVPGSSGTYGTYGTFNASTGIYTAKVGTTTQYAKLKGTAFYACSDSSCATTGAVIDPANYGMVIDSVRVRTGTGSINMAAGGDMALMGSYSTVSNVTDASGKKYSGIQYSSQSTIYTGGRQRTDAADPSVAGLYDNTAYMSGSPLCASTPSNSLCKNMPWYYGSTGKYYPTNGYQQLWQAFAVDGGTISVNAGGSITSAITSQMVSDWLMKGYNTVDVKTGASTSQADYAMQLGWWVRYDLFKQGIGTLGGGNVSVTAGGDIVDLSVVSPTNGRNLTPRGTAVDSQAATYSCTSAGATCVQGGGNLYVHAGGDIKSGLYYVETGVGDISAGGSITTSDRTVLSTINTTMSVYDMGNKSLTKTVYVSPKISTLLALGDADLTVQALGGLEIETIFNPTSISGISQRGGYDAGNTHALRSGTLGVMDADFFTYGARSAVNLHSLSGDVTLDNDYLALEAAVSTGSVDNMKFTSSTPAKSTSSLSSWLNLYMAISDLNKVSNNAVKSYNDAKALGYYPGSLTVEANQGSILINGGMTLLPQANGGLDLYAGDSVFFNVRGNSDVTVSALSSTETTQRLPYLAINLSDVDPSSVPSLTNPVTGYWYYGWTVQYGGSGSNIYTNYNYDILTNPLWAANGTDSAYHAATPVHEGDPDPVRIYTLAGDIENVIYLNPKNLAIGSTAGEYSSASMAQALKDMPLYMAKSVWIRAGRDVKNLDMVAQNVYDPDADPAAVRDSDGALVPIVDLSMITAGRDIIYSLFSNQGKNVFNRASVWLMGEGELDVMAGRSIDLGNSNGILTIGNGTGELDLFSNSGLPTGAWNKALSTTGASLALFAGLGTDASGMINEPDYDAIVAKYLDPVAGYHDYDYLAVWGNQYNYLWNQTNGDKTAKETNYNTGVHYAYTGFKVETVPSVMSDNQAWAMWASLTPASGGYSVAQKAFLRYIVQEEMVQCGVVNATLAQSSQKWNRGYDALVTMFPGTTIDVPGYLHTGDGQNYSGSLTMVYSKIRTDAGGAIDIFVPGGDVNVGLSSFKGGNGYASSNNPLGILTLDGGWFGIVTSGSVLVNQSRIFTEGGGDGLIWSTSGDIDAGRGAKTTVQSSEQVVSTDDDGNTTVRPANVALGAGIGEINGIAGQKTSSSNYAFAPVGTINAGEAGFASTGDSYLVASHYLNLKNNVTSGGMTVGLPETTSTTPAVAPVTNDSAASAADEKARQQASLAANGNKDLTAIVIVQVVGYGGGAEDARSLGASNATQNSAADGNTDPSSEDENGQDRKKRERRH